MTSKIDASMRPVSVLANPLASFFKDHRRRAGYSAAELAEHSDVSIESVMLLETHPERAALQDIYAVANVLNLDPGVVLELLHALKSCRNSG